MLFTELNFWVFFAVVMLAYILLPHRAQNRMLLLASYVFYGAWDWRFLGLILFSTIVDYLVGFRMGAITSQAWRRQLLWISIGVNLGLLGVFKYFGFFVESFSALLARIGYQADPFMLSIVTCSPLSPGFSVSSVQGLVLS